MNFKYLVKALIIGYLFLLSGHIHGQIKTNVTFSNPYLNQGRQLGKQAKAHRRFVRDSLQQVKKLNKVYQAKIDSMVNGMAEQYTGVEIPDYDSASLSAWSDQKVSKLTSYTDLYEAEKLDSLVKTRYSVYQKQYLDDNQLASLEASELDIDSINYDSLSLDHPVSFETYRDGFLKETETRLASGVGADALPLDYNPMASSTAQINSQVPELSQYTSPRNLKQTMQKMTSGKLSEYNSSLENAHKSMNKLKKKYVTLPSLADLSTGIKRNSLSGQPLIKRLKVGGNLHIKQSNSIDIDFSPSVAYRLNRKWSAGIEGMYRSQFGGNKEWSDAFDPTTYGGRLFSELLFYRNIYVRTDVESLHQVSDLKSTGTDDESIPFLSGALAGIGKSFGLGKNINGKLSIQYNFLHKDNGLYSSPWVFRFGFDLKELSSKRFGISSLEK